MKTLKRHNVFLISMDCGLSPVCKWHTLTYYSYILKTNETQDILCSYHVIIQTHDNSFWSLCTKKQKHLSLCLWKLLLYATPSPPPHDFAAASGAETCNGCHGNSPVSQQRVSIWHARCTCRARSLPSASKQQAALHTNPQILYETSSK